MAKKKKSSPKNPEGETEVTPEEENEENTESNAGDESAASSHEELTLMLEDARNKADEHWNQVLLSNAELENTRRRARQDVENAHKFALEKFALELLPVKDIEAVGVIDEPFNPEIHQAMTMQESAEHAPNTVIAVMQKGYQLNDRLIRPAMVVVSKAAEVEEEK